MATKQSSSNKKPTQEELEIEVKKARLSNMVNTNAKQLAVIFKLALKGEKLKKDK
jgi:hypothetical protein